MTPSLQFTDRLLRFTGEDAHESIFPAVWLYDNRPEHRDQRTGQRLVDIIDLPNDPVISHAELRSDDVHIRWSGENAESSFSFEWLLAHCLCDQHASDARPESATWTREQACRLQWLDHAIVSDDNVSRLEWLRAIARDGLAFLQGVPARDGYVLELASVLGYITETNYGRLFDVRAVNDPNNLAYTPLGLGVHTDNPYRDPAPGYQILHCLEPSSEGGDSIFVDGFLVAHELQTGDPDAFRLLTTTPVPFAFRDSASDFHAERPMIQLSFRGEIEAVHYNNRSLVLLR